VDPYNARRCSRLAGRRRRAAGGGRLQGSVSLHPEGEYKTKYTQKPLENA
jgi:hypothetical protein